MQESRIFISYSHKDEVSFNRLKQGIEAHSSSSKKLKWNIWSDLKINTGDQWHERIQDEIQNCNAAIFLVSANAFASNYIKKEEFQKLIKKNIQEGFLFFPILIGDCDFSLWEELSDIQFFNPQGQNYGVAHKTNEILPYKFLANDNCFLDTYHKDFVKNFEEAFINRMSSTKTVNSSSDKLNITSPSFINERIDFLEANILDGFKLKKNYMGIVIPQIGDRYKIYVYKEFSLLKPKDSIKCRIHINNKQKIKNPSLTKEELKLETFISHNNGSFNKCEKIDEISVGEEYLQFKAYLKQDNRGHDITFIKGDSIAIFYTYEVYCAHYGNELVRKTSVFPDSELVCEIVYPENDDRYEFNFYERTNENRNDLQNLNIKQFTIEFHQSVLYKVQPDKNFKKILDCFFLKKGFKYKQVDYKEMLKSKGKPLQRIYNFVVEWNSTPFLADPEMFLIMERYINDGSPSGFTKTHAPSYEFTPYSGISDFEVKTVSINGDCSDYGTPPDWLNRNEVIIHPEYNRFFLETTNNSFTVVPTASARTLYLKKEKCYAKLQYNKEIGRLIRTFTPEKIKKATRISAYLTECFDSSVFSENIFFLPENFGRIIDLDSVNHPFGSKYLGMVIRDYIPYPNLGFKDSEWRLIPAFSLFAKEYKQTNYVTKSIIELLFDYKKDTIISYEDFLLDKILKPVFKLYFELLIKAGLHIEGHAQNVLFLIKIEKNKVDLLGAVIRDFESVDIDIDIIKKINPDHDWSEIASRFSKENDLDNYQKRNSFLFDFKLGEYLISPILEHSKNIIGEFDNTYVINEIRDFNKKYVAELDSNFYPKEKWYSYDKVAIDRSTDDRPWIENNEMPKFR